MTRIGILGGGPAGVGAAYKLREHDRAEVVLFERNERVGGNAGSFDRGGHRLDFGSHRLHPACDPEVLADIKAFLGDDLLDRPRHGRIRLRGKWVHFPLAPVDLLLHLDKGFTLGTLTDMARKALPGGRKEGDTFASVLEANLGRTICRHFYFPYAVKLWGLPPDELSAIQARRRVSAGSFGKLIKKVLTAVPGFKPPGAGRFFYPRGGFGQISEAYAERAERAGAEIKMGWEVTRLAHDGPGWTIDARRGEEATSTTVDHVWSTIPLTVLARVMGEAVPEPVREAARAIDYRAMILVYLELDTDRFTEYDAHYFPESELTITRLSEPKNYAVRDEPKGRTVLCAEIPCTRGDELWEMGDDALATRVAGDLRQTSLPLDRPPVAAWTARLPQAYPVYRNGYEQPFGALDAWADDLPDFLTFGRQGLFAHDNTHHALHMAYAAVECLDGTGFDQARWEEHRKVFATHVVED